MSYQHSSSTNYHIIMYGKKIKIIYFTHMMSILNSIFTVVFYLTR
jgi:hypothetical protein